MACDLHNYYDMVHYATKMVGLGLLLASVLPFRVTAEILSAQLAAAYTEQRETLVTTPQQGTVEDNQPYKIKSNKIVLTQLKPVSVKVTSPQGHHSSVGLTLFTRDGQHPSTGMSANTQF